MEKFEVSLHEVNKCIWRYSCKKRIRKWMTWCTHCTGSATQFGNLSYWFFLPSMRNFLLIYLFCNVNCLPQLLFTYRYKYSDIRIFNLFWLEENKIFQIKSNEAEIESLREEYHQRVATLERKVYNFYYLRSLFLPSSFTMTMQGKLKMAWPVKTSRKFLCRKNRNVVLLRIFNRIEVPFFLLYCIRLLDKRSNLHFLTSHLQVTWLSSGFAKPWNSP